MKTFFRVCCFVIGLGGGVLLADQGGPFNEQIENFWRLISTGGRTFTSLKVTGVTLTAPVSASSPLWTDAALKIVSHAASGNTTTLASISGALTNGHIAKFDANGNIVDGGASAGCTSAGGAGAIQQSDGAGGCTGTANARLANDHSIQLNEPGGSVSQVILQAGGTEAIRIQSSTGGTGSRLTFASGNVSIDTALAVVPSTPGALEIDTGTQGTTTGTTLNVGAYKAGGTAITSGTTHLSAGSGMAVANVGANSCGTTSATIAGNNNANVTTVGATAGTQCRITFTFAAGTEWDCAANDDTTTVAVRTTPVDSTHTDLIGSFTAGDKITAICFPR